MVPLIWRRRFLYVRLNVSLRVFLLGLPGEKQKCMSTTCWLGDVSFWIFCWLGDVCEENLVVLLWFTFCFEEKSKNCWKMWCAEGGFFPWAYQILILALKKKASVAIRVMQVVTLFMSKTDKPLSLRAIGFSEPAWKIKPTQKLYFHPEFFHIHNSPKNEGHFGSIPILGGEFNPLRKTRHNAISASKVESFRHTWGANQTLNEQERSCCWVLLGISGIFHSSNEHLDVVTGNYKSMKICPEQAGWKMFLWGPKVSWDCISPN